MRKVLQNFHQFAVFILSRIGTEKEHCNLSKWIILKFFANQMLKIGIIQKKGGKWILKKFNRFSSIEMILLLTNCGHSTVELLRISKGLIAILFKIIIFIFNSNFDVETKKKNYFHRFDSSLFSYQKTVNY